jgi:hypothetical protein
MLLLSTFGTPALGTAATCTAGIPNPSVIETTPTVDFADHGDATVTHTKTGLMWKQCVEGLSGAGCATGAATLMLWSNALNAANTANAANGGLGFAGHTDWRLPNAKELQSIVESCGNSPSINQTTFPATPATQYFWSSTSVVSLPGYAWAVTFNTGAAIDSIKGNSEFVRLVRGGQPVDSFDALNPSTPQLVYTPVTPCRIMDTRNATPASGVQGPITGGALKQIPGFVSVGGNWTQYGQPGTPSNCGLTNPPGTSIKAVAIVITILNPNFDAFLGVSDTNNLTATLSTIALNYTHGQGLSTQYIVPQIASNNIYFAMPAGLSAQIIFDVVGYFVVSDATALACTTVTSGPVTIGASSTGSAVSPACSAGYTLNSGSCDSDSTTMKLTSDKASGGNTTWTCTANNSGASAHLTATANCCGVPGK